MTSCIESTAVASLDPLQGATATGLESLATGLILRLTVTLEQDYCGRQGRYVMPRVCLSVCLFVCLLATLRENYWTDVHEYVTTGLSVHKEELIKFWKSSTSDPDAGIFLKHSSTLWDRTFFCNFAYISGESRVVHGLGRATGWIGLGWSGWVDIFSFW